MEPERYISRHPKTDKDRYLNYYQDVETGQVSSMYLRNEHGSNWEMSAVRMRWWYKDTRVRKPVYRIRIIPKFEKRDWRLDVPWYKRFRLKPSLFTWGGPNGDWWYIGIGWSKPKYRQWGLDRTWYDGPHAALSIWFFNISWSTPWTSTKDLT